jgi:hypothetical protein
MGDLIIYASRDAGRGTGSPGMSILPNRSYRALPAPAQVMRAEMPIRVVRLRRTRLCGGRGVRIVGGRSTLSVDLLWQLILPAADAAVAY